MIYAGFWRRLGAFFLDLLIFLPLAALVYWLNSRYRLFALYFFIPSQLISLFYYVYLVKKYGGTPGKLLLKIKITKIDGSNVTYKEAVLRFLPDFILYFILSIAFIQANLRMTDLEYLSVSNIERGKIIIQLLPAWYGTVELLKNIWTYSEFLVLLTNSKKRAIHDFIAGTVVIKA